MYKVRPLYGRKSFRMSFTASRAGQLIHTCHSMLRPPLPHAVTHSTLSSPSGKQELAEKEGVEYIPGGATQNSIRVAQWLLKTPGSTAYIGCIGKDDFGAKMQEKAKQDGVNVSAILQLSRRSAWRA